MRHHIHIASCAPRSGTTLMTELMINGFAIDAYPEHEMSVVEAPDRPCKVLLSKDPKDAPAVRPMLLLNRRLWVIYVVRDPRDVICSRHRRCDREYFCPLSVWKRNHRSMRSLTRHPRVMFIRYEDLVDDPDAVQDAIARKMPFLERRAPFSEFHKVARPSGRTEAALGGVREVNTSSLGRWRDHLPRVAGELALHGAITSELIDLGYEKDGEWMGELEGVEPVFTDAGIFAKFGSRRRRWSDTARLYWLALKWAFGAARVRPVSVREP